jgi:outer membrane protein insertion porin family/translocation and assembly module TamA
MVNNTLKRSRTYLGTRFSGAILSYGIGTPLEMTVLSSGYGVLAALAIFILFCSSPLLALPVEELDPNREWRTKDLIISGNKQIASSEIEDILSTKTRPWYAPWRSRPVFEPAVFASDLERIVKFYQDKGYYEAKVTHDLDVDAKEGLVAATIQVSEGEPIRVAQISVEVVDAPELKPELDALVPKLPLHEGNIFAVDAYQKAESQLKDFFYDKSRAAITIQRKAEVILDRHVANVSYTLHAGPQTQFGTTTVEGLKNVKESIVFQELTYKPGEQFSGTALRTTEKNLRELDLFSQIVIERQPSPPDTAVPVKIRLEEKPPREIRIGLGYGTEDQLRGQIRWRNNNWLGGARRIEVGLKASFIVRELDFHFLQPHFLAPENRFMVNFGPQQFDEPGYFLNSTRLQPRLERKFTDRLTGFLTYRLEYDNLSKVPNASLEALGPFAQKGLLSGVSAGFLWNRADDPFNPTRGWTLSFAAEQVGGFLGGRFDLYKLQSEAKGYYPLAEKTVFASRLKLGFAEPLHGGDEVPLFERFYAGGGTSVRGYSRSRLGPLSTADDPLGGRSLIEGSFELRQQFTEKIGGALFIDFGQVSLRSFDVPVDNLKFSAGFGARYNTPVGPVRFDLGFPFRPPRGDRAWQIHFSIGPSF